MQLAAYAAVTVAVPCGEQQRCHVYTSHQEKGLSSTRLGEERRGNGGRALGATQYAKKLDLLR